MAVQENRKNSGVVALLRCVVLTLLVIMCSFKLFLTYRGLNQPDVMDQAQIARSVACGEGFKTLYHRPIELGDFYNYNASEGVDFDSLKDMNHAPLNILSMAAALRCTNSHRFEETRIAVNDAGEPVTTLYGPDRVIAGTSCLFFLVAMALAYMLITRLFDDMVATSTLLCFAFCDLMLDYSISGLAQPLMMCFLFGALHLLLYAKSAADDSDTFAKGLFLILSFVLMALMVLSGWFSLWIALGYFIFCAAYFRPYGLYGFLGVVILGASCAYTLCSNYSMVGNIFGNAFYGIYNCFGGSSEDVMRSVHSMDVALNSSMVVIRFFGSVLNQVKSLYTNCGSVIVAPFFFLALFFRFKRPSLQCMKWALCSMWIMATIGMALYGTDVPLSSGQLMIMFGPLFVAYGFSLLFNFIARLNASGFTYVQMRGLAVFIVVLMTAGGMLANLPGDVMRALALKGKAQPHYPPYYPPALNCDLYDKTDERGVLVTDQPWAVAWYANRRAVWIPKSIADYSRINEEILPAGGLFVQGLVITPASYDPIIPSSYAPTQGMRDGRPGGYTAIAQNMGDFTPLALNLPLAILDPRHSMYINNFTPRQEDQDAPATRIGKIVAVSNTGSPAQFDNMVLLRAGAAALYCKGRR